MTETRNSRPGSRTFSPVPRTGAPLLQGPSTAFGAWAAAHPPPSQAGARTTAPVKLPPSSGEPAANQPKKLDRVTGLSANHAARLAWERHESRHLTYSCSHRSLRDHHAMIDLDGVEFCGRCHAIPCLVEAGVDVGQVDKRTAVVTALAKAANTVALLVIWTPDPDSRCACGAHAAISSLRVRRVHPEPGPFHPLKPAELAAWFAELRLQHGRVCRGGSLGHETLVLDRAHHGLAVTGDADASARIPLRLIAAVRSYLGEQVC